MTAPMFTEVCYVVNLAGKLEHLDLATNLRLQEDRERVRKTEELGERERETNTDASPQ